MMFRTLYRILIAFFSASAVVSGVCIPIVPNEVRFWAILGAVASVLIVWAVAAALRDDRHPRQR
jgi:hypothetical protein